VAEAFRIRRGTPADIPVIAHHRLEMFAEMGFGDPSTYAEYSAKFQTFAAQEMAAERFLSWLAETAEGEIIAGGAVMLVPYPSNPKQPRQERAFLLNVFTEPAFRRRGIARSLVQTMMDWCREQGFIAVFLHASDAGRPLYQSMGFQPTSELRFNFYP
jgi:GNAT superfamily N-acetyltransferase